jgi:hypothetical protein
MRNVRAKSDDSSSRLLPRNEAWLIAIAALPNVQIDEVHPAGREMDKYFAIAGSGYGHLPQSEGPRDLPMERSTF